MPVWKTYDCLNCGVNCTKANTMGKYCSNKCQGEYQNKQKVQDLIDGKYVGKHIQFTDNRSPSIAKRFKGGPNWAKQWLLEWNDYQCQECGIGIEWNGQYLTLQVEHIDGKSKNNDIENLCLLCPNCHAQTETWGNKRGPGASDRTERYA